jgi:hypothetical protein
MPSIVRRGPERSGCPVGSVTLNCDFKKSIWPERVDVLFQLNFRRYACRDSAVPSRQASPLKNVFGRLQSRQRALITFPE